MRKYVVIALCVTATMAFAVGNLFAQISLKELSKRQALKWKAARTEAESIATVTNTPIRVEHRDGRITELQRFDNGIPLIYSTDNLTSAKTIATNKVWSGAGFGYALSGSTDTLGEWDGGAPLPTHQELTGRVLSTQGGPAGHATHVAGTMIASGVDANAHGMSYEAKLKAYEWTDDASEMAAAAAARLRVSNHSYGRIVGWDYNYFNDSKWVWFGDTVISGSQDYEFGFYDSDAETWDDVANGAPNYLICKSAGNDRNEGPYGQVVHWVFTHSGGHVLSNTLRPNDGGTTGYRTVSSVSTAKNILTVGAVNGIAAGYHQPSDVVMSNFSCWGPTDDGRVKPDIVADGVGLYSSYSTSNTSYATMSGTSMATPSVTGSIGILLHHQRNLHGNNPLRSSTLKAIVLHTADDAGNTGPDYKFGWGLMNTLNAVKLMTLDSADGSNSHISELQMAQGDTLRDTIYSDGTQTLRATICWIDPSGNSPLPSLNPTTHMLVNDLDLRIIRVSNSTVYSPWILDPVNPSTAATTGDNNVDNVEQVIKTSPAPGTYIVKIYHKGTLSGGLQKVSLVVTGNVTYNTPLVDASGDSFTITPGTTVQESIKVYNKGTQTLAYTMTALNPWLIPQGSPANIAANDSGYLHFTVNASTLRQWFEYADTIDVSSNDTVHPHYKVPVGIETTGPQISMPAIATYSTDSGQVYLDSIYIRNTGTNTLTFAVTDTTSAPWLTVGAVPGPVAAGDSIAVTLTFDATTLIAETHTAQLKFESNDSLTGTLVVQLDLIVYKAGTFFVHVADKWNLVSVPVIPSSFLKSAIYPSASSNAYEYAGGYVQRDTLARGIGYWLKFSGSQSVPMHGFIFENDSFHVNAGWNLIGSLTYPVPVAMITTNTIGLTTSDFYGYSSMYQTVDTLKPGIGYWVKVNVDGYLNLSSLPSAAPANRIVIVPIHELPPSPPADHNPEIAVPDRFALEQAYPNPFNPSTVINYALPTAGYVTLKIYNILGQEIYTPVDGIEDSGYKSIRVDLNNMPSGVYIYRLTAGSFTETRKMMLMK